MKRIFEWIGGFCLIAFSFYFTDKVSFLVASKSELMQEIRAVSGEYYTEPVDARIDNRENTIIPGKYGKEVNDEESYLNMHDFGLFNENYLVYNQIKPNTSLEDNKDKYITKGNELNRNVSLIVYNNEEVENYLSSSDIKYNSIITTTNELEKTGEQINGASSKDEFKKLNSKISNNQHVCIADYSNEEYCLKYDYYLIKPKLILKNNNTSEIKKELANGSIILISETCKLENLELIINDIKYKDLNIVYISELIDEKG